MSDINEVIAQAQQTAAGMTERKTFNLAERLRGRGFPTESLTLYLDEGAGFQLVRLMNQDPPKDQEALAAFNDVVQQVSQQVLESSLTFDLRGISSGHIQQNKKNLQKDQPDLVPGTEEFERALTDYHIAPHIIRITDHAGGTDEHLYTPEEVSDLRDMLPSSEWYKLNQAVTRLSFTSGFFENAADAGFLPKS